MGQIAEDTENITQQTQIGEAATTPPAGGLSPAPAEASSAPLVAPQGITIYDALLLGMVTVWAANPSAIKWALQYMDPLTFNALRFTLATLVPLGLLLASKEPFRWQKGDGLKLIFLGLIGHGLYQVVFILALNNTLAGNVALILSVSPAFVAIFGALLGYERARSYTWLGIGFSLAGVGLVILGSGKRLEFGPRLLGDLMMVAVTMMWALYTVLSQKMLRRYSAVKLNALAMPVGAALLLIVATPSLGKSAPTWGSVPGAAWLILALSGLLAVSASYIIWYKGLQKLGATRTAVYANLVPVLAAVISFVFLKEQLGWQFWAGMLLVLTGVSLARFGGRLIKKQ